MDWASRRAGSTVSTHACRPRSAARRPVAAAAVVLPTPPEPQQTMIRVRRSSISRSTSSVGGLCGPAIMLYLPLASCGTLLAQGGGEPVQAAQVDAVADPRQLVTGLSRRVQPGPLKLLAQRGPRVGGQLGGQLGGQAAAVVQPGRLKAERKLVLVQPA